MFEVKKQPIGRFDAYRLINRLTGEYLEVLADIGAGLNGLMVRNSQDNLVSVIAGYPSEQEIRHTIHSKYKGCKLSPFPNRLYGGKYEFDGAKYQMHINDVGGYTNLHALLHNRKFEVVETLSDKKSAKLVLSHDYKGIEQGYPFTYRITITYKMTDGQIEIGTKIENTDSVNLPIGDGWHPYFMFDTVDEVVLHLDKAKRISSLTGNPLAEINGFESKKAIGELKLDDCFEISGDVDLFNVTLEDMKNQVRLKVWQQSGIGQYRYLQLYTPDDRKSIAVEPVSCPPDAFNSKKDLIIMKSGEQLNLKIGIEFSAL